MKLRLIDSDSLSCLFLSCSVFFPQQLSPPSLACDTFSLQQPKEGKAEGFPSCSTVLGEELCFIE